MRSVSFQTIRRCGSSTILAIALQLHFLTAVAICQSALRGTVTEKATKKPLVGATIRVVGSYYGAKSDKSGKYVVKGMKSGSYTVEVSFLGFKKMQRTGIKLSSADTLTLDFAMEEQVIHTDKEVVVIGDRPLVDVEETQTVRTVSREDMDRMVAENITDILTQQTGIVSQNKEIYIRGSRGYEANYMVDGIPVQDALSGTGMGLQLNADALREIELITGGINAKYGRTTSGVINVKTREGKDFYSGSLEQRQAFRIFERSAFDRDTVGAFSTNIFSAQIDGPEPIFSYLLPALGLDLPGKLSLLVNAYYSKSDDQVPRFARVQLRSPLLPESWLKGMDNAMNGLVKLTWQVTPQTKLNFTRSENFGVNQNSRSVITNLEYVAPDPGYQYQFLGHFDGAVTYSNRQSLNSIALAHSFSSSTYMDLRVSDFRSFLHADANGLSYLSYTQPFDISGVPSSYYDTRDSNRAGIIPGDGFFDVGNGRIWRETWQRDRAIRLDFTHFFEEKSKLETGVDLLEQSFQQAEINSPWFPPLGLNNDFFSTTSVQWSAYGNHNIQFKGMILNYGLRLDAWAPGELVDRAIADTSIGFISAKQRASYLENTTDIFGRRTKFRVSPRIGVSHPITNTSTLYFNYQHLNKTPRPQQVYTKLDPKQSNSSFQTFGNPDLEPETTISYEMGVRNQLSDDDVLTLTAYYKDIFDYVQSKRVPNNDTRFIGGTFTTFINSDYSRSRGIELEYKKRIGQWFSGVISCSYSVVTGKSSGAEQGAQVIRGITSERLTENYMAWDRPFFCNSTLNFNAPKGQPFFGVSLFEDVNLFVRFNYQSGQRYTPQVPVMNTVTGEQLTFDNGRPAYETDEKQYLESIGESWWWADANIQKDFTVAGIKSRLTIELQNIFDNLNSTILNPVTGRAYTNGDPTPTSWNDPKYPQLVAPLDPFPFNPARYTQRRSIRLGLNFLL